MSAVSSFDRASRTAAIPNAKELYEAVKIATRRRDVRRLVLDFETTKRIDGAGIAVISLAKKLASRSNTMLELSNLDQKQRDAIDLVHEIPPLKEEVVRPTGFIERLGQNVLDLGHGIHESAKLFADTGRQLGQVIEPRHDEGDLRFDREGDR